MKSKEDNLLTLKYLLQRIENEDCNGEIINQPNKNGEVIINFIL